MDEIIDSIRGHINERLNSPMIGAYVFAWLFFNYRVVLWVFSGLSVDEKIINIEGYLHDTLWDVLYCFGWPMIIAAVYIFIAPFPSRWILAFTLKQQEIARELKQKILGQRVVTVDELEETQSRWRVERESLERHLHESELKNTNLRAARERAESELAATSEMVSELNDLRGDKFHLSHETDKLKANIEKLHEENSSLANQAKSVEHRWRILDDEMTNTKLYIMDAISKLARGRYSEAGWVAELGKVSDDGIPPPDWLKKEINSIGQKAPGRYTS